MAAAGHEWKWLPPAGAMTFEVAKTYCAGLTIAGGRWRLPTVDELRALFAAKEAGPKFPFAQAVFMSSARDLQANGALVCVGMSNGLAMTLDDGQSDQKGTVRCVR
jgi:hypothetical protein